MYEEAAPQTQQGDCLPASSDIVFIYLNSLSPFSGGKTDYKNCDHIHE